MALRLKGGRAGRTRRRAGALVGIVLAALPCGCAPPRPGWVRIPAGTYEIGSRLAPRDNPPRLVKLAAFDLGRHEVTVRDFAEYLNATGRSPAAQPHPDLRRRGTAWVPAAGRARKPITTIRHDEAVVYCQWLSIRTGRRCRLPTIEEWEVAARGGIRGAPWPWGWGSPKGRMAWNLDAAAKVGRFPPNPFGLFDMAGNVWEWCAADRGGELPARGGAWSERDPAICEVQRIARFRADYMDADVGFRVAADAEAAADGPSVGNSDGWRSGRNSFNRSR